MPSWNSYTSADTDLRVNNAMLERHLLKILFLYVKTKQVLLDLGKTACLGHPYLLFIIVRPSAPLDRPLAGSVHLRRRLGESF